jgi:hypothetical protein
MMAQGAVAILREQAQGTPEAQGSGFADVVWRYLHQGDTLALSAPWSQISGALQDLVSETGRWAHDGIPLDISYAVSEILTTALALVLTQKSASVRESLGSFAWRVACAWEAMLAGDIDDIAEHVANETLARGIPPP